MRIAATAAALGRFVTHRVFGIVEEKLGLNYVFTLRQMTTALNALGGTP